MKRPIRYTETVTIHLPPGTLARMEAVRDPRCSMPILRRALILEGLNRREEDLAVLRAFAERKGKKP